MQLSGKTLSLSLLACILIVTLGLYWPGLSGTFLLDDLPNLSPLGRWPDQDILTRSLLFLLSGDSGPTGRPVALLTFLMNDTTWPPGSAFSFKLTNVLVHLLNGALVFWFLHRLFTNLSLVKPHTLVIISVTTFLWLIHPLQVSTVLYVIQRMTELSALFTLAALITWLYGRDGIASNNYKITWIATLGIVAFGLLAILSKENGALIPLYILTLEILFYGHNSSYTPALKKWLLLFTVLPALMMIGYLVYVGIYTGAWQWRPFNLSERLLSESRALVHYLVQITWPNISGMGIFHDDFPVSHHLTEPPETLASIAIICALIVSAWFLRKRTPLFSFAIAWFFVGHLMESTTLPLELYFEHRNYLPMLGILLAVASWLVSIASRYRMPGRILIATYLVWLPFLTYSNTYVWGQPLQASILWANENPRSLRAQMTARSAIQVYANKNKLAGERHYLETMIKFHPNKPTAQIEWLGFLCAHNMPDAYNLGSLILNLKTSKFHITDLTALQKFAEHTLKGQCAGRLGSDKILEMLSAAEQNTTAQSSAAQHVIHYTYGLVYAELRNLDKAMQHLDISYRHDPQLDIRLLQSIYLYTAGLYNEAMEILDKLINSDSPLSHKLRQDDVDQLKALVKRTQGQADDG